MKNVYLAYPSQGLRTQELQALIDSCAAAGGGQVRLTAGVYLSATLYLKSHVELYLDAGATLMGSSDFSDYSNQCPQPINLPEIPRWYDSLIAAVGQKDIAISGEGVIDGADCLNEGGEQGFRGPHAVYICDCEKVCIQGVKLVRSACYTLLFERCRDIVLSHVSVRAGQDGFRFTDCRGIRINHCDIRSGDDCISGSGNCDAEIEDTMLNTPGDATMLFSCVGLRMKRCRIWSACEYPAVFRDTKRYSLCHTAIVHGYESGTCGPDFSDDWLIEDTVFENVQGVYRFENVIHGRKAVPARRVVFDRVRAVNMVEPILIVGDPAAALSLEIRHSSFHFAREDADCTGMFIDADTFGAIVLEDVRLRGCCDQPIRCQNGESIVIRDVVVEKELDSTQLCAGSVEQVLAETTPPATIHTRCAVPGSTSQVYPKDATEEFRGPLPYIPKC